MSAVKGSTQWAYDQLRGNKKIRRTVWNLGLYILLAEDNIAIITGEKDLYHGITINDFLVQDGSSDWELFVEAAKSTSLVRLIKQWPVKSMVLRKELVKEDICPECGSKLDVGWDCTSCNYDASSLVIPIPKEE